MNVPTNSLQAWLLASRPKTLTAALIPILPGAALAGRDGHFGLVPVLLCALFACLMQVAANFATVVNKKVADSLGVTIPEDLMQNAQIVE